MKWLGDGKSKNVAYLALALALTVGAGVVFFLSRSGGAPDAATKAAMERTAQMEAAKPAEPQQPELPVEKRAPRGAIHLGK
jgi:hypothetical protein